MRQIKQLQNRLCRASQCRTDSFQRCHHQFGAPQNATDLIRDRAKIRRLP